MQWIIDHLAAFLIACIILFILLALQLRSQDASIETTQFDTAKTSVQTLASVIEQDFLNIGAGYLLPSQAALQIDTMGAVKTFAFWTRTDPSNPEPQRVTYRWRENGAVTLDSGEEVARVELERQVGMAGAWSPLTANTITDFHLTLREEDLDPIYDSDPLALAGTKRIDVKLRMISPLGKGDLIEEVRWSRQFKPLNLQRHKGMLLFESY